MSRSEMFPVGSETIEQIMTSTVSTIAPDCPIEDVLSQMYAYRIPCVVVCEDDVPVGTITEQDIAGIAGDLSESRDTRRCARDIMSAPVRTVRTTDSIADAVNATHEHGVRHLPVVTESGELAGIVTQTELFRSYSDQMEQLVAERTEQLAESQRRLEELSKQDQLLEVGNRRALDEALSQLDAVAKRYGRAYSVVLCDLDQFKQYNDSEGQSKGDAALREVARRIQTVIRTSDRVYRYSGAELLVVLPETSSSFAGGAAQRIRLGVAQLAVPFEQSEDGILTISCGVAGSESGRTWPDLVRAAEDALRDAKQAGPNTVRIAF